MNKSYHVRLTDTERAHLQELIAAGTPPARKLLHARILLKADEGPAGPAWGDQAIADAVEVSQPTVSRVRKQYVAEGLEAALNRRAPTRVYHRKLDPVQGPDLPGMCLLQCAQRGLHTSTATTRRRRTHLAGSG